LSSPDLSKIDFLSGSLGYAIKRAQVRSYEMLFEIYADKQLTPARMTALCLIGKQPGMSQSALAEILQINRASVIKIVNYLVQAGYVICLENPADKRSHALEVTEEGYRKLCTLVERTQIFESKIARSLTKRERDTLLRLLEKVAEQP